MARQFIQTEWSFCAFPALRRWRGLLTGYFCTIRALNGPNTCNSSHFEPLCDYLEIQLYWTHLEVHNSNSAAAWASSKKTRMMSLTCSLSATSSNQTYSRPALSTFHLFSSWPYLSLYRHLHHLKYSNADNSCRSWWHGWVSFYCLWVHQSISYVK